MTALRFLLAQATFVAFGAFIAFAPGVRTLGRAARLSMAFLCGAVLLTVEAMLFSIVGIHWNALPLSLPLAMLSLVLIGRLRRTSAPGNGFSTDREAATAALLAGVVPLLHVAGSFAIARGVSADYVYFWGVKTSRFVVAKGIDSALLGWHFFDHAVPDYPPLVPVVQGWGSLLAAGLPWTFVPVISALWLVVGAVAVNGLLARRLASGSAATALFWFTALSISAVYSYSGGNAETPLIAFVTVACASLMVERSDERWTRAIAAMAFAGALLTKVEALVAWSAVVLGTIARDVWLRRPDVIRRTMIIAIVPLLALGLWFFYQWRAGLPVGYEAHGQLMQLRWSNLGSVLEALPRHLNAGAWGLAWLIPLVVMAVAGRRSWIPALPALTGVAALFAFFVFDYLHDLQPPIERIGWTLPRISQPALSLWILAAAVIGSPARNQQAEI